MLKRSMFISTFWIVLFAFWALPALSELIVDTAWVRRYNGPGNSLDWPYSIEVDGSANVYVTGQSSGDYATIKYYPNGDTAWVRRYNGPENDWDAASAVAVDGSGNVFVTGYSYSSEASFDYATIKYYPNGDTAWVRRYNGPANSQDSAAAITVDASGNVYVTGNSTETDTEPCHCDYATIKYYPNGDTAWVRRYDGPGIWNQAIAIAVDDSGNIYVTGYSYGGDSTSDDYATIKYYPNGDTAWVRTYNGPGNDQDYALAMAVDGSGNVYVTGWSYGNGTDLDYATIKYYPDGDTAWVRRYNGLGNGGDVAYAIAVDDSSNVYVTGVSYGGSGTGHDYATIKYYPDGDTVWVRRYDGPVNDYDWALAIAVDGSGNVYVTGGSYGGSGTIEDYATIKYFQALRGDGNQDGVIDIGDVVCLITYLFENGSAPCPLEAGDANCDGVVNIADVVYLINYLFIGGPPPDC